MTYSIPVIIAVVLFIVSVVWAVYFRQVSAELLALWAIAAILILPDIIKR